MAELTAAAAEKAIAASDNTSRKVHRGGTYVNMEGPAFSTRAESNFYRSAGMSVIGMTNMPEAKLAREAEICYTTVAMVTDYDCWHPEHDSVTVDMIIAHLMANVGLAKDIIRLVIDAIGNLEVSCTCGQATGERHNHQPRSDTPKNKKRSPADYRQIRELTPKRRLGEAAFVLSFEKYCYSLFALILPFLPTLVV